jgi:hypothetical protein
MNLFNKKKISHFKKEEESVDFDQYQNRSEAEETLLAENGIPVRNSYYPNPALFRRLIEGTSFDQRIRVEEKREIAQIEVEQTDIIHSKNNIAFERKHGIRKDLKEVPTGASVKKKKFIKKERKRLGNIVHEVLGYPQRQDS